MMSVTSQPPRRLSRAGRRVWFSCRAGAGRWACAFQVDAVLLVLGIAGIDGVLACGAAHAVQHFLAVDVMGVGGFTAQGVVRFFRVRHTAIHAPMVHDFAAA